MTDLIIAAGVVVTSAFSLKQRSILIVGRMIDAWLVEKGVNTLTAGGWVQIIALSISISLLIVRQRIRYQ